ncbi:hypothetical protein VNI00_002706 [Paramarasmius palmivorus]|uniref:Ubiquitin-like protease family profile domain-containing protein n=1 Tax=Paramarasmius palmivorus TaxID=297713 RepID=A0AAW0DX03_9AGAR
MSRLTHFQHSILSYPPNAPGAVNITNADLGRLEPSEYLNDTLIEFGLKLWHKELEDSNPEVAQKIHIFNSFFYKKLNKKNVEEGFQSVRRWTSKFDIFQKEYVIIPINENLHWYLAIIHQPGNILLPPPEKEPPTVRRSSRKFNANEAAEKAEEDSDRTLQNADTKAEDTMSIQMEDKDTIGDDESAYDMDLTIPASASVSTDIHSDTENVNILDTSGMHMEVDGDGNSSDSVSAQLTNGINDGMDLDGADNDITMVDGDDGQKHEAESPIPPESFYAKPPSRKGKEKAEPDDSVDGEDMSNVHLSQPAAYIITLDSLGTQHRKVCRVLGEYLKLEAKDKHQNENTTKPISKSASVPPQPNFSDCGLYLLHFARVFVEKTDYLMRVIQRGHRTVAERRQDWNESDVASQRERLAEKIRELSKPWKEQRMAQLEEEKKKKAKTDAEQAVAVEDSSDSDLDIVEGVTISRTNSTSSAKGGKGSNKKKRKAASRLRG